MYMFIINLYVLCGQHTATELQSWRNILSHVVVYVSSACVEKVTLVISLCTDHCSIANESVHASTRHVGSSCLFAFLDEYASINLDLSYAKYTNNTIITERTIITRVPKYSSSLRELAKVYLVSWIQARLLNETFVAPIVS